MSYIERDNFIIHDIDLGLTAEEDDDVIAGKAVCMIMEGCSLQEVSKFCKEESDRQDIEICEDYLSVISRFSDGSIIIYRKIASQNKHYIITLY